jgi:hypothetical protein
MALCGYAAADSPRAKANNLPVKLTITITPRAKVYFLMEPVIFDVDIKNSGDKPVEDYYRMEGKKEAYTIMVKNDNNELLPITRYGLMQLNQAAVAAQVYSGGGPIVTDLLPGEIDHEHIVDPAPFELLPG